MYVCVYVCFSVCVRVFICMNLCICVRMHARTHACMYLYSHTCTEKRPNSKGALHRSAPLNEKNNEIVRMLRAGARFYSILSGCN